MQASGSLVLQGSWSCGFEAGCAWSRWRRVAVLRTPYPYNGLQWVWKTAKIENSALIGPCVGSQAQERFSWSTYVHSCTVCQQHTLYSVLWWGSAGWMDLLFFGSSTAKLYLTDFDRKGLDQSDKLMQASHHPSGPGPWQNLKNGSLILQHALKKEKKSFTRVSTKYFRSHTPFGPQI
ncbi:hypothetical protein VTG60DRAFT_5000 [Thermothelomyces hinnuleus]